MGSYEGMPIPGVQFDGLRHTVNFGLTPAQTTWNLRSALNVAALNCLELEYDPILQGYKSLLKDQARGLSAANKTLESEFRQKYGPGFRDVLDGYMTQVYNYFALPPVRKNFCDTSLAVAQEIPTLAPADLDAFAARSLPRIEQVFIDFFGLYDTYRTDLARWDAEYGPPPPAVAAATTGYINPLDPAVTVPPGATVVGATPTLGPATTTATASAAGQPVIVLTPQQQPAAEPVITLPSVQPTTTGTDS
ncbi:hypothetical protein GCM10011515_17570 [Tsuneonella deserti]|uniref:Phasin protein n=2 Tax=Tsuneonella deserti TaxID=2035528 RepID=A0ABQ1SA74_9SPHN|nr:hypothetical protein GCM10011515_17570 [Tsuneonella deserti]